MSNGLQRKNLRMCSGTVLAIYMCYFIHSLQQLFKDEDIKRRFNKDSGKIIPELALEFIILNTYSFLSF